jgi:hypothetical protein
VEQAAGLGFFDGLKVSDAAHWSWRTSSGRRAFVRSYLSRGLLSWLAPLVFAAVNFAGYARNGDLFYLGWALGFLLLIPVGAVFYAKKTPTAAARARLANRSLFED